MSSMKMRMTFGRGGGGGGMGRRGGDRKQAEQEFREHGGRNTSRNGRFFAIPTDGILRLPPEPGYSDS